ncbi:MAG TPA: DUF6644 family protein [Vicinamibacterales bacterium]|jgi:hypothetical protein
MPFLRSLFEWVDTFPTSIALRESQFVYPYILTAHVVGMCIFAGLICMMDLRLLGVGNLRTPFSQVQRRLFPWQMAGLAVSAVTGLLLVYGQPMRFYSNFFFWIKTLMMVLAGVNALAFHRTTYHSVASWDSDAAIPFGAKLAGALGLALWAGVVVSGRLIAYNWFSRT